ncbi:MAG TPA: multifunctional phosphoenolpyruvate-protein phosphotransferase/phosphocarrier protein HPr/PTS system fructose-like transporter subunit IIA, partial [Firmicutes bacterium]|nr:multifunctional phosphoenolpyruvate-protein phosphotransferase/phosphocarrier protein HPr/PTS system fructose-like transporter subunit IIA [Bacillota bacterium]
RIYADHGELLTRHLRGIIRSSAHGKVWVMAPMVSGPAQARWFLDRVREQQRALAGEGVEFDPAMPVGVMIEIPSAAIQIDALCEVVDFFSVGTNDLTQYLLAMERGNPAIADIYEELHPALIRMLHSVVETAHSKGKWVGLCGELARNPRYTPLLVGLGFDELSMSAPAIPAVKSAIAGCSHQQAAELAARAFACSTAADIRSVLDEHAASGRPLTGPGLILVGADCRNKAEAIRELCALVQLDGRCADMNELEDAVWAREETYSTGLGHGIAIPHCKSDLVAAGSLALLKLDQAIEWGAVDDQPVDLVLMLVMPEGDEGNRHLKIFAALARRLMHEEFRAGLRAAEDADGIIAFLDQEIGIDDPKGQINE